MRHRLRIRLGGKAHALVRQEFAQVLIVFNNAVVHNRKPARFARVRVRVFIGRLAVRRPARMADADRAADFRAAVELVAEHLQPALCFGDLNPVVRAHNGDARGVIAAVFQAFEPIEQNGRHLLQARISDNSTHNLSTFLSGMRLPPGAVRWTESKPARQWRAQ